MLFLKISLAFVLFVVVFGLCTRKYRNPYKLIMIFGKKGSGKSTLLIKMGLKYQKKGYTIYTNMLDCNVPTWRIIDAEQIGQFVPPPRSVTLLDEVGMLWNNRDYKKFRPEVRDFFKLQRHYRSIVVLASQSWDIDKSLRLLTDRMYLTVGLANVISVAKRISRTIVLTESTSEAESRISENLKFTPFWTWKLTWIPRYAKYYDSYTAPSLPELPYREIPQSLKDIKEKKVKKLLSKAAQRQTDMREAR